MEPRKTSIVLITTALLVFGCFIKPVIGETIWVDVMNGDDSSPGTKDKPLRTFEKIARIVNESNEPGPTVIKVNPGVYDISETVLLKNERPFTRENRLTIEAAVLPDDPNWHPKCMPVILATIKPTPIKDSEEYYSIIFEPEVSHVTIRGLKFLGNPAYRTRSWAVFRGGMNLEDLVITQCVFVGDKNTFPYNICILTKGNETILDHNIFYDCETCVVFWDAEGGASKGNAMRYCIVDGATTAAVWTTQTAEDFDFHHNVITRCGHFWMRAPDHHQKYRIRDSVITDCGTYSAYGIASELSGPTGPEVTFDEVNVTKQGTITLKKCEIPKNRRSADPPRDYLHIVPGTLGSDLGAGLFTESVKSTKTEEHGYRKKTYTYKEADEQEILADVFLPATEEARAVVLYIHGGGFMFGSRTGRPEKPLLDKLIEANYAVVSIDYRMAPETKLEEIVKDVTDACIWIRNQGPSLFNADPNRLGVIGGSAGAFLATACGYTVKPQPQAVVAISGFADFEFAKQSTDRSILKQSNLYDSVGKKILTQGGEDRYKLYSFLQENGLWPWEIIGFEPKSNQERVNALLPINHINSDYPATLLIHSKNDPYVPLSQTEKLSQTLTAQKIESELFIVPQGHSSEIIQNDPDAVAKIITFLDRQLKGIKKR